MSEPTTAAGRLLLASGLTFHSGIRLADHPELVCAIEVEAVTLDVERLARALEASNFRDMRYTNVERQAERIAAEYEEQR